MYTKLVENKSEFGERARQALEQLPSPGRGGSGLSSGSRTRRDNGLQLTIVGGSLTSSRSRPAGAPGAPVRTLTVISRTPLEVRLREPVELSCERMFQGEIDADITVNGETAVPRGSRCHLKVVKVLSKPGLATRVTLRLTTVVVDGLPYQVSAATVRVKPTGNLGKNRGAQLPSGTRILFRLNAPLVVARS